MKAILACVLTLIQLFQVHAVLIYKRLMESQSLELSWSPQWEQSCQTGLQLYHCSAQSQTTVLSLTAGGELRVAPELRNRLQLRGRLDSLEVNVTISQVQHSDTGLYVWEQSCREYAYDQPVLSTQQVLVFVEGSGCSCQCSPRYRPLLWIICAAAGLLLLTLSWLAVDKCVKVRCHPKPQPSAPIYEEMSRRQQTVTVPQNNHEPPAHLQEVNFPVYANPNIRQPQDNYYACPRQLALQA